MLFLIPLAATLPVASAFYLPGVSPTDYEEGQKVPLLVNSLTPEYSFSDGGLNSVLSYDYYFSSFHFCQPDGGPKKQGESIGSILFGDRIFNSPFELTMLKDEACKFLCKSTYPAKDTEFVESKIWQDYMHNWLIDGLPAAATPLEADSEEYYSSGFPLGTVAESSSSEDGVAGLNNHYDITVEYHPTRKDKFRVVGVVIEPSSRKNAAPGDDGKAQCDATDMVILNKKEDTDVVFTYSVKWKQSDNPWATRWDKYLHVLNPKIHWFSLINSTILVIFLTAMVSTVLLRALHKDIGRYNEIDLGEDFQEDSGWKLVHGDVFRAPKRRMLLSIFIGSGSQLFVMTGLTLVFALLGFLSPSNRGSLTTMMILFYTLFSFVGGYVSARVYKTFGGEAWKLNMLLTPLVVPGILFASFFALNFFLVMAHASGAVPFGTMLALVAIWFGISLPLSGAGSFLGFKKGGFSTPVRTNQIPRQIPPQPTYLKTIPSVLMSGILPFGAIFVELYFIMNSIWFHKLYYMFGFLFVCYGLMVSTSAAVTILMTYFLLTSENYHWQWRSFFMSGACAFYVFACSMIYWFSKMSFGDLTSSVLYLGYSLLTTFIVFILTGTVGFASTFIFVRKIYSSIKID
uniref:Transmembrane 9 superfamily member n=1 Tax=Blastobotrys adeninivorans TaxID=409370 RepID=A0A060T7V6_BLAAD